MPYPGWWLHKDDPHQTESEWLQELMKPASTSFGEWVDEEYVALLAEEIEKIGMFTGC